MTKRIRELVKRILKVNTLIDVGCDHGKITYYALKEGKVKKGICTDISAPSLSKAKLLVGGEFPETEFYVADGIPQNCPPFDFTVIAGMGGEEIVKILKNTQNVNHALLQPMNNVPFIRVELVKMGYKILSDEIFIDDKFYNVIYVEKGTDCLTEEEIFFGRTNLVNKTQDFIAYVEREIVKTEEILKGIAKENKRFCELSHYLDLLRKII